MSERSVSAEGARLLGMPMASSIEPALSIPATGIGEPISDQSASIKGRGLVRLMMLAMLTGAANVHARVARRLPGESRTAAIGRVQRLSRLLVRLLGVRVRYEGAPPAGVAVFVANHRSYTDVPLVMARAPAVFLAKAEIADWPLFGTATRLAGTVFVRREDAASRKVALAELRGLLHAGTPVTVFPEGTTTAGPGLLPFRPGIFRVAAELALPVIPIAIRYAHLADAWIGDDDFLRHFLDRFGQRRVEVSVAFGPAIRAPDGERLRDAAHRWIGERLSALEPTSAKE